MQTNSCKLANFAVIPAGMRGVGRGSWHGYKQRKVWKGINVVDQGVERDEKWSVYSAVTQGIWFTKLNPVKWKNRPKVGIYQRRKVRSQNLLFYFLDSVVKILVS